jgi:predicted amino acid racemase
MTSPHLTIDLDKIEHNARTIARLCRQHGITLAGVTKVTCGNPAIADAMRRGGVDAIGESHLEHIRRLRRAGVTLPYLLLRLPSLSEAVAVVDTADVSFHSEIEVLTAVARAARARGRIHEVVILVDLGDLREGLWPDDLVPFVGKALALPGIRIKGIGTNLACFGGVVPSVANMSQLVTLAVEIERRFDLSLDWISGLNSSGLDLIASGHVPRRVNHARIGEAIVLGRETTHRRPWPGTFQDAFVLHAEVLELKDKPSIPVGQRSEDAFGETPAFTDRGKMVRALLDVGREDVDISGITPTDARLVVLGGSSNYLVVDATAAAQGLRVGDEITFSLNYRALLAAMTSAHVAKCPLRTTLASRTEHRDRAEAPAAVSRWSRGLQ